MLSLPQPRCYVDQRHTRTRDHDVTDVWTCDLSFVLDSKKLSLPRLHSLSSTTDFGKDSERHRSETKVLDKYSTGRIPTISVSIALFHSNRALSLKKYSGFLQHFRDVPQAYNPPNYSLRLKELVLKIPWGIDDYLLLGNTSASSHNFVAVQLRSFFFRGLSLLLFVFVIQSFGRQNGLISGVRCLISFHYIYL